MTGDRPDDPHSRQLSTLLALKRDLSRLTERVDDLEVLREGVGAVVEAVEKLTAKRESVHPGPVHWPDLDDATYAEAWPALLEWMRDVFVARCPRDAEALRPCWWMHPDAVDALTAAWLAWLAAYRDDAADPTAQAQWQGTWRLNLRAQLQDALRSCRPESHVDQPPPTFDVVSGFAAVS